jgi:hypothetical protein
VKHFHIFRQVFDEIPTEGKKRKNPNAEVKLAFPFTPDHKPLIERQPDVFARLPINSTGVGLHVSLLFHFRIRCSHSPSFWSIPISPPRPIGRLWMRNQQGTLSSLGKLLRSSKLRRSTLAMIHVSPSGISGWSSSPITPYPARFGALYV